LYHVFAQLRPNDGLLLTRTRTGQVHQHLLLHTIELVASLQWVG
jgi:hypothetical protein